MQFYYFCCIQFFKFLLCNYNVASLQTYINRAIIICSSQKLLKEELKTIEDKAIKNGFKIEIV